MNVIKLKLLNYFNDIHLFSETGGLFMLAIRLMQLFSENHADFTKIAGILGLYFQIRDDYCNLCLKEVCVLTENSYFTVYTVYRL